ncbi:MAG: RNA polymerase sigma factor [Sandaracinus sp.]
MGRETDEELMQAYVAGDPRAFDALFSRYAARLHAFFSRSFRSGAVADDLVQTTFLKVHAARASFDPGLPVRPWLFGIAARVRVDELRRRYRVADKISDEELGDLVLPAEGGADRWPEANEEAERVRKAIDTLPEAQRVVVLLHRFEGLTFGEIAEALSEAGPKLTEVAVRVRAFRAFATLREQLADLVEEAS